MRYLMRVYKFIVADEGMSWRFQHGLLYGDILQQRLDSKVLIEHPPRLKYINLWCVYTFFTVLFCIIFAISSNVRFTAYFHAEILVLAEAPGFPFPIFVTILMMFSVTKTKMAMPVPIPYKRKAIWSWSRFKGVWMFCDMMPNCLYLLIADMVKIDTHNRLILHDVC